MTKDEALQMCLEYIETDAHERKYVRHAIKAALEAKDEPVATIDSLEQEIYENTRQFVSLDVMEWMLKRYYHTPPQQEAKDEPWSPVSIGVDVTKDGVHVVGIYALDKDTSQIFYAKHYPVPQRTWVGLTGEERDGKRVLENGLLFNTAEVQAWEMAVEWAEQKLKERNT